MQLIFYRVENAVLKDVRKTENGRRKMKESRQEDYDLTEEVEQFINFLRKKYEMDKEKSSGGAVMKKYVSPCGMEMDEEI